MYAEDGKVVIQKGFMTYASFLEAYEPHKAKQAALHFRIATHGKVDGMNTHPFRVSETLGLIHNGIINKVDCNLDKDMSDTWHFVEKIMKPFEHMVDHKVFQELVENYIGYSKLVTLDGQGNFNIYNEKLGDWDCACWFSNKSYETRKVAQSYRGHGKHKWNDATNENEYETPWNTPKTVTKTNTGKALVVGQELKMLYKTDVLVPDFEDDHIPQGAKVILDSFGQLNNLWVKYPISQKIASVPIWKIDIWEEPKALPLVEELDLQFCVGHDVAFTKNYNHFRIGEVHPIKFVNERYVGIDVLNAVSLKLTTHLIPKTHISPADTLVIH